MTQETMEKFQNRFDPNRVAPNTFQDDNDVMLFVHIPKTAGMSVGKTLQSAFEVFHPVSWEHVGKSFRQKTQTALYERSKTPKRQVLMGHFSWVDMQLWRNQELPMKCATIIRDPLARFVSNYNYNCSAKHPQADAFKERFPTLEAYAHSLPCDYQLSTMIGMFYDFDHALELLHKYYSFIGLTEHLGASLQHLKNSHGFLNDLPEHRENTGTPNDNSDIPQTVKDIVAEKSFNDQKIHNKIKTFYSM